MDILIIEDNEELGKLIFDFIVNSGYSAYLARSAEEALSKLDEESYRLLLLDVMLPGQDGFSALTKIRKKYNMPVLMMSARTDDDSKILGMETGADDYIEKPYDIDILLAKIRGIFKRKYEVDELKEGSLTLNSVKQSLTVDGQDVPVTGKEFELLRILLENKGVTMKKEYLFNSIWGSDSESELQTLNVHINGLRKKIEKDPKKPEHIVTVWGVGYRWEV